MGLIGLISLSFLLVAFELSSVPHAQNTGSPFFVGVEIGWRANVTEAKALIDRVKNFTNLVVIADGTIMSDEAMLNETCDYAYDAGMYIIVYWDNPNLSTGATNSEQEHSYNPSSWLVHAKERYGKQFLGAYYVDEPGGKILDSVSVPSLVMNGQVQTLTSFKDYATAFTQGSQVNNFANVAHQANSLTFTSDYGLYWFDYKSGYDVVLAELGWNNSKPLQIALARGAATVQNKSWGVTITWKYSNAPYLEPADQLYDHLVLAYDSGATYAVVYDSSQEWLSTTLTEDHFEAMKNFWTYTKQNPQNQGNLTADAALVLPQDYGFGFRSPNDSIWGLKIADGWSQKMYNDIGISLNQYGSRLDIVYNDSEFDESSKNTYGNVFYWTSGAEGSNYPVVNSRSTMGYSTIQDAIDSYATYAGDKLYIKPGTYRENVAVTKPISLLGENKRSTIIDGNNKGNAVTVTSCNVTLTGFTIQNGGNVTLGTGGGLILEGARNCNITENIITASNCGIYLNNSADNTLKSNKLENNKFNFGVGSNTPEGYQNDVDTSNTINGKPIYYWLDKHDQTVPSDAGYTAIVNCQNVTVQGMHLSGNFNGVLLAYSRNVTVIGNKFTNNCEGITLDDCSGTVLRNNALGNNTQNFRLISGFENEIDTSNTVNGKAIVYWVDQHDREVPTETGYVALINCSNITVQGLHLSNNGHGIFLYNTNNSKITQNIIQNEDTGIELEASTNNTIAQNTLRANTRNGISVNSSDGNTFFNNTLVRNVDSGFFIFGSSNNTINSNNMTANGCGIRFQNSSYTLPERNVFSENWITANNVFVDLKYGCALNNVFYRNNFVGNVVQLIYNGTNIPIRFGSLSGNERKNFWDNGKEGNYWSDYGGTDENHDGIGDVACFVRNLDQDNYPLMQPFQIGNR